MLAFPGGKCEDASADVECHPVNDTIFDMDVGNECEALAAHVDIVATSTAVVEAVHKTTGSKPSVYDRLVGSLGRLCRCIARKQTDTSTEDEGPEGMAVFREKPLPQHAAREKQCWPTGERKQDGEGSARNQGSMSNPNDGSSDTITDVPVKSIEHEDDEKSPLLLQVVQQQQQQQVITQLTTPAPVVARSSGSPFAMVPHPLAMMPTTILLGMLPSQPAGPLLPPPVSHKVVEHAAQETANDMQEMTGSTHQDASTMSNNCRICLVLDLDETLVHSSFSCPANIVPDLVIPLTLPDKTVHDIYVCKRPGVDVFLERALRDFEVVIFTASLSTYADPVINFLDTQGRIRHRLYRDACVQLQGLYIKDLSRLGRPLDKTLVVDNSPASFLLHPEHAMAIKSWFSDTHDSELHRLSKLLDDLHARGSVTGGGMPFWRWRAILFIKACLFVL